VHTGRWGSVQWELQRSMRGMTTDVQADAKWPRVHSEILVHAGGEWADLTVQPGGCGETRSSSLAVVFVGAFLGFLVAGGNGFGAR